MGRFKDSVLDRRQILLFSTSLDDAVAADCDVRALNDVMENLDWSVMESGYSDSGCPAYPPRVLAKLMVYAYSKGTFSSRKIEDLAKNDKRYMWLAGGLTPDHHTIARFRKRKYEELRLLFVDSVRLCASCGLVLLNVVSVDSTKIAAKASRKSVYDARSLSRELAAVDEALRKSEATDSSEDELYGDGNGSELPEDLKDPVRRKAILAKRARELKEAGTKSASSSDPECRVMKVSSRLRPGYSVDAAVDSESQVIVGMKLSQSTNDAGKLPEMVDEVEANVGLSCDVVVADRGFSDESTLEWSQSSGQDVLVVPKEHPGSDRSDLFASHCFLPDGSRDELICPAGKRLSFKGEYRAGSGRYRQYGAVGCQSCSFRRQCVGKHRGSRRVSVSAAWASREAMRQKLASPEGKRLMALRRQTVEPVFGQMKANRGFDRFTLWGKNGATAEAAIICLAHNLWKYIGAVAKIRQIGRLRRYLMLRIRSFRARSRYFGHPGRLVPRGWAKSVSF